MSQQLLKFLRLLAFFSLIPQRYFSVSNNVMKDLSYGLIKSLCFSPLGRAVLCVFIISCLKGSPVAALDFFSEIGWLEPFLRRTKTLLHARHISGGEFTKGGFVFAKELNLRCRDGGMKRGNGIKMDDGCHFG